MRRRIALPLVAIALACRTETPTQTARPATLAPSASASATEPPRVAILLDAGVIADAAPAADASDATASSRWCMKSGYSEVNGVKRAPFVLSGAEAATRLASSAYSKRILPGKHTYLVEAYGCPDPVRCKAASTVGERRDACDYLLRLYVYDPAPPAGGRGVFYVDSMDHVDATTGELWRDDGAGWKSERM